MPSLFNETGHASQDDRNAEAIRILDDLLGGFEKMDARERRFVEDMNNSRDRGTLFCSGKQLYWLRDLYEKYCL